MLRLPSKKAAALGLALIYNAPHLWTAESCDCQRISYTGISKKVAMLRWVPTRFMSRMWGHLASCRFPWPISAGLVNGYAKVTGCNTNEIEGNMSQFRSISDFFTRKLKKDARPIDNTDFVSPVDGRVLHISSTTDASSLWVEQVKGVNFRVDDFMGPRVDNSDAFGPPSLAKGSKLMAITIYLSPRDYHRIHAPTDWKIRSARHFPGQLLTVFPQAAKFLPGLFVVNERVVLSGNTTGNRHLSMGCVGAMNVGRIKLSFDPEMRTNKPRALCNGRHYDTAYGLGHFRAKGDEVGYFETGSTVVLVVECRDGDMLHVKAGDRVKMGRPLMTMAPEPVEESRTFLDSSRTFTDTCNDVKSWVTSKLSFLA